MTLTPSNMIELGTKAPDFQLPDTDGNLVSLTDFESHKGLLVIFMCNHCPYVKHIRDALANLARRYTASGIGIVGINSNDVTAHPADSPDKMREEVEAAGYCFPYLFDESQEVAKKFGAACTPEFFLFDGSSHLIYRGQFDDSRPGNDIEVTGKDLQSAVDSLLNGRPPLEYQVPSVGCNIKWKSDQVSIS